MPPKERSDGRAAVEAEAAAGLGPLHPRAPRHQPDRLAAPEGLQAAGEGELQQEVGLPVGGRPPAPPARPAPASARERWR